VELDQAIQHALEVAGSCENKQCAIDHKQLAEWLVELKTIRGAKMKIKAILSCINSARDNAGNCYWAFRWTDTETGKQVVGTISGGESNISWVREEMGFKAEEVYYYRQELPKREFRHLTADWEYAGCPPDKIAAFIKARLNQ
jgi:hypothetical protein